MGPRRRPGPGKVSAARAVAAAAAAALSRLGDAALGAGVEEGQPWGGSFRGYF